MFPNQPKINMFQSLSKRTDTKNKLITILIDPKGHLETMASEVKTSPEPLIMQEETTLEEDMNLVEEEVKAEAEAHSEDHIEEILEEVEAVTEEDIDTVKGLNTMVLKEVDSGNMTEADTMEETEEVPSEVAKEEDSQQKEEVSAEVT